MQNKFFLIYNILLFLIVLFGGFDKKQIDNNKKYSQTIDNYDGNMIDDNRTYMENVTIEIYTKYKSNDTQNY